jgi:pimeloyl-ACP methyl ester carboxylesterase
MTLPLRRSFVDLPHGTVHVAECGDANAPAVLLLHQTPRSWREYVHVLPLLGAQVRAIAMDTAGFGDSAPVARAGIEAWAAVAAQLLDALRIDRVHVAGHHTGGVIAVELAASQPQRVASVVLSSTPLTNAAFREARKHRPPIDAVEPSDDGAHLAALWQKRQAFYPPGRPDLLHAFVADAMRVADVEAGHRAVASYRMEDRVAALRDLPVLVVHATDDPFASPHTAYWRAALPQAKVATIDGGGVPLPDQCPEDFTRVVLDFVAGLQRA